MNAMEFVSGKTCPFVELIDEQNGLRMSHGPIGGIGVTVVEDREIIFTHRKMPYRHNVIFGVCAKVDEKMGKLYIRRIPLNSEEREKVKSAIVNLMDYETLFIRDP